MAGALVVAALLPAAAADLDFSRVHLVDSWGQNLLFRSNLPVINSTFAYDTLINYMTLCASSEGNLGFPTGPFFLDIHSFDNIFESSDTKYEVDWATANPTLGNVTFWPLYGQLLPPADVTPEERAALALNNTALWGMDQLPERLPTLRERLQQAYEEPRVFLYHCEAGCDRTGEFSAGYYMQFLGMNATGESDCRSAARCARRRPRDDDDARAPADCGQSAMANM